MWKDEIVEEIHQIREAYAKSFNDDWDAIFADLRRKQAESGKEIVNLSRQPGLRNRWSGRVKGLGKKVQETGDFSTESTPKTFP